MAGFLIVMLGVLFVLCVVMLVFGQLWMLFRYIMEGVGIRKIAERRGLENSWLVWVPVVRHWLLGAISDQYRQMSVGKQTNRRNTLLFLHILINGLGLIGISIVLTALALVSEHEALGIDFNVISPVASIIMVPGILCLYGYFIAGLACYVYTYFPIFDLFLSCRPEKAVRRLVLSIIFPVLLPFFVFTCRDSDDGLPVQTEI